jgi:tetratricopeptide (TPR) repeat protein
MVRRVALGAVAFLAWTQIGFAGGKWLRLHSPNFELYTTDDAKSGRDAIRYFEEVRSAFTEILGVKLPPNRPVTVIAFRNAEESAPYRPRENVFAYYKAAPHRDFIVMQDLDPEHRPVVLHEYTHLVVSQAGMKLPLWLNEGFAELYSTMKQVGGKILVGRMLPGRMQVAQSGLVSLREIVTAGVDSPYYKDPGRSAIFYAESWALIHMLKFSKPYSAGIDRFLDAVGRGEASDLALERVYAKPLAAIQRDLDAYVHGDKFNEGVIKAKLEKVDIEPEVAPADPLEIAVLLAGIESDRDDAVRRLRTLCAENPGKLPPHEALAWICLKGPHPEQSIEPFRRALELKTQDATLCFDFAVRLRPSISDADYLSALRQATAIDPANSPAQKFLAAYALQHKDYAEAFLRLRLVKKLDRSQAFPYYNALAYAAYNIGKVSEAKSAAERAQHFASTPQQTRIAQQLLAYVNGGGIPATGSPFLPEFAPK